MGFNLAFKGLKMLYMFKTFVSLLSGNASYIHTYIHTYTYTYKFCQPCDAVSVKADPKHYGIKTVLRIISVSGKSVFLVFCYPLSVADLLVTAVTI